MSTSISEVVSASLTRVLDGELREIALDELHESPWNPRQYYPDGPMAELIASMRESGFRPWLPIMVRPSPDGDGYEIGAGHRRSRAAREADIETVPCIVREMSDAEFLDVLNFDNCGREDVHPLHEASGWAAWMEKTGKGVLDIAARIGQSKEYVYQRLKYSALIEPARNSFIEGKITSGHAILIARLQPNDQKRALKYCEPPSHNPDARTSVRMLASFIQNDIHLAMEDAPFDQADPSLLPLAGTCVSCPKRTKNAPDLILIAIADMENDAGPVDECTDPGCFNAKRTEHIARIKNQLLAGHFSRPLTPPRDASCRRL